MGHVGLVSWSEFGLVGLMTLLQKGGSLTASRPLLTRLPFPLSKQASVTAAVELRPPPVREHRRGQAHGQLSQDSRSRVLHTPLSIPARLPSLSPSFSPST